MISVELWTKPMLKIPENKLKHAQTITTLLRGTISTHEWFCGPQRFKCNFLLT